MEPQGCGPCGPAVCWHHQGPTFSLAESTLRFLPRNECAQGARRKLACPAVGTPVVGSSRVNTQTHSGHSGDPSRLHCSRWNGGWRGPRELREVERNAGPHARFGLPKIQPENTSPQSDGVGKWGSLGVMRW